MVVDFHTHLFPDALASKTLPKLAATAGAVYHTDGTVAGNLRAMDEWQVDYAVVLHIATNAHQQQKVNDFAAQVQRENPKLICFGSVYPKADNAIEELHRIRQLGLRGIKLHPAYQEYFVGDKAFYPLYEEIEKLGFPVVFHAGLDPVSPINYSTADQIAAVARDFPKMTVIGAHMGAMGNAASTLQYLCELPNVYLDTSICSEYLTPDEMRTLVTKRGADHVLFGTDCPWSTAPKELAFLKQTGIAGEELEKIKWKNAFRLLHLEGQPLPK